MGVCSVTYVDTMNVSLKKGINFITIFYEFIQSQKKEFTKKFSLLLAQWVENFSNLFAFKFNFSLLESHKNLNLNFEFKFSCIEILKIF